MELRFRGISEAGEGERGADDHKMRSDENVEAGECLCHEIPNLTERTFLKCSMRAEHQSFLDDEARGYWMGKRAWILGLAGLRSGSIGRGSSA